MAIIKQGSTTLNAGSKGDKGDTGATGTGSGGVGKTISILSDFDDVGVNDIASIQGDIDLASASLTIPNGVTLRFEGGSIKNGTINFGTDNVIEANAYDIFGYNNTFTGSIKSANTLTYPDWFGALVGVENKITNFFAYKACTEFIDTIGGGHIYNSKKGTYYLPDRNPVDNGTVLRDGGYDWGEQAQGYTSGQGIIVLPSNANIQNQLRCHKMIYIQ